MEEERWYVKKSFRKRFKAQIEQTVLSVTNLKSHIDIAIRNKQRYRNYYKPYLKNAREQLELEVERLDIPIKHSKVLSSLLTHLSNILDERVVNALVKMNKVNPPDEEIINIMRADLETSLQMLTHNYVTAISEALARIYNSFLLIREAFLSELHANSIELVNISSSGSDFHRNGRQVLMLTFRDKRSEKKVIYKPSSLESEALITGNTEKLKRIDPTYENRPSIIEILNTDLPNELKQPTPMVLPIHDDAGEFGFMEYLSYNNKKEFDPEPALDIVSLLDATCKENYTGKRASQDKIQRDMQEYINFHHQECLIKAAKRGEDYIFTTDEEENRYSIDCGLMLAVMYVSGIVDSHKQNLIIWNGRPIIIDTEACLSNLCIDIRSTTCAEKGGSMNGHTNEELTVDYLTEDNKLLHFNFYTPEKNRAYRLVQTPDGEYLIPCTPNPNLVMDGFRRGLEIFSNNQQALEAWYQSDKVQHMTVRVPLYLTQDYKSDLDRFESGTFSYEDIRRDRITNGMHAYYSQDPQQPYFAQNPCFLSYISMNPDDCNRTEYEANSLPTYQIQANQTSICTWRGTPIRVPLPDVPLEDVLNDNVPNDQTRDYYDVSLLESTKHRVMEILNNPQACDTLVEDTRDYFVEGQNQGIDPTECVQNMHLKVGDYYAPRNTNTFGNSR